MKLIGQQAGALPCSFKIEICCHIDRPQYNTAGIPQNQQKHKL